MLLADHNLKISHWSGTFQILECQGITGKLMKHAEFPDPPEELLTGCGLWRTTHLVIRALGNSVVDQRVTLRRGSSGWLNVSLGPGAVGHAGVGWGQGVKPRKDVQLLPQPSQQRDARYIFPGLPLLFWASADLLLSPPHCIQEMCLSFPSSPLSLWSTTSGAEEQRAPHLWTALLPHPWGVAASSRPWQIYAPWVPHTTALRDFISLGYKILAITKSILCSQPTDFSTWSIWEN